MCIDIHSKRAGFLIITFVFFLPSISFAQHTPIRIAGSDLLTSKLKEGKNQYLVYIERTSGEVMDIAIWERIVSYSKIQNEDAVVVSQQWKNQDTLRSRTVYSINRRKDFTPVYHFVENGKGVKEAFDFSENDIHGSDSISQNSRKDFYLKLVEPTFNWELDLEILQCLPYGKSKIFRINFYHPGSRNEPAVYDYEVVGEEILGIAGDSRIDCWLLKTIYKGNETIFWIEKETGEAVKVVEHWNGIKRYKIKFNN